MHELRWELDSEKIFYELLIAHKGFFDLDDIFILKI